MDLRKQLHWWCRGEVIRVASVLRDCHFTTVSLPYSGVYYAGSVEWKTPVSCILGSVGSSVFESWISTSLRPCVASSPSPLASQVGGAKIGGKEWGMYKLRIEKKGQCVIELHSLHHCLFYSILSGLGPDHTLWLSFTSHCNPSVAFISSFSFVDQCFM